MSHINQTSFAHLVYGSNGKNTKTSEDNRQAATSQRPFTKWLIKHFNQRVYQRKGLQHKSQFSLLGVRIDNTSLSAAVDWCLTAHKQTQVGYFINTNSLMLARDSRPLRDHLNLSDMNFADGSGVRLGAAQLGYSLLDNVNGTDLLPELCNKAVALKRNLYLFGGEPGVAQQTANNLRLSFPGLSIVGTHHGFLKTGDNRKIIDDINASGADIVLVALGSPLQERWIQQHRHTLNATTLLAVGGLFDFYSGRIPRAPLWMRQIGMEWLYRLRQQPIKKARRYLLGNPRYLLNLILNRGTE